MKPIDDKTLIPLCKRLAARFVHQARHLGAREDVFNELVNAAYVAGREGKYIIWTLLEYVTKPSIKLKRRAFRTGDARQIYREKEKTPSDVLDEKECNKRVFDLMKMLSPDDFVLISLYFGHGKTYGEIGEIFSKSDRWASGRIKSILTKLRKEADR